MQNTKKQNERVWKGLVLEGSDFNKALSKCGIASNERGQTIIRV